MATPKIIYVQAHGGGADKLDKKFISFNSFREERSLPETGLFPYILRIVSPGKSANSNFESDRMNVNFIYETLTNRERRNSLLKTPNTRSFSGAYLKEMEGSRGFGELLTSTSLFSSNDIIFNEIVEVELEKRSGSIHKGEGGEEDPGGFGIFMHDGSNWVYKKNLSSILVDIHTGKSLDVSILDIVNHIVSIEGSNIIVIFPNCSPFSDVSYTDSTKRAMWSRIKTDSGRLKKIIDPYSQFKFALEIVTRAKNFFQGQKRFNQMITSESTILSDSSSKKSSAAGKKEPEKKIISEDRIGIIGDDDVKLIKQIFFYFFKDYYDWIQIKDELLFPEIFYILSSESIDGKINPVKFIMCLLLLLFKCHERNGGIIYEELRESLWEKIIKQTRHGPIGRKNTHGGHDQSKLPARNSYRVGRELEEATRVQYELIEYVNEIARNMNNVDPRIPRFEQFNVLLEYAKIFSIEDGVGAASKGGKRKTRKRNRKKRGNGRKRRITKNKYKRSWQQSMQNRFNNKRKIPVAVATKVDDNNINNNIPTARVVYRVPSINGGKRKTFKKKKKISRNTRVRRCVGKLKKKYKIGKAIAICQYHTKQGYKTGKKLRRNKRKITRKKR